MTNANAVYESEEQSQLVQVVLDSISEGVTVVGREGKVLIQNPAVENLIGIHTRDMELVHLARNLRFPLPGQGNADCSG